MYVCEYTVQMITTINSDSVQAFLRCVICHACLLVVLLQKETLMKKVEEEKKQEIKLSRLQAVQRVKQYKQVCAMQDARMDTLVLCNGGIR